MLADDWRNVFGEMTILSLENAVALPYLTYRLAQDGARVLRLEDPVAPDPNRRVGDPIGEGESAVGAYFAMVNCGKEGITLNLKAPQGRELLRELIVRLSVDIFATNQLPSNYERLGIDYESLHDAKPDLIWLGITGFGPDSDEPAYDPILQARTGLMDLTGEAQGRPQLLGIPLPGLGTGEHGYGLLMKALLRRALTGQGCRLDLAMIDSTASWLVQAVPEWKTFGRKLTRQGSRNAYFCPVGVFPTADGYLYLAIGNDKQWARLVTLPGFETLERSDYDCNEDRVVRRDQLDSELGVIFSSRTTAALLESLLERSIAAARVQDVPLACEDPYIAGNLLAATDPLSGMTLHLAPAPYSTAYLESTGGRLPFSPRHGEHDDQVLGCDLGLSKAELQELRQLGIIRDSSRANLAKPGG